MEDVKESEHAKLKFKLQDLLLSTQQEENKKLTLTEKKLPFLDAKRKKNEGEKSKQNINNCEAIVKM